MWEWNVRVSCFGHFLELFLPTHSKISGKCLSKPMWERLAQLSFAQRQETLSWLCPKFRYTPYCEAHWFTHYLVLRWKNKTASCDFKGRYELTYLRAVWTCYYSLTHSLFFFSLSGKMLSRLSPWTESAAESSSFLRRRTAWTGFRR